MHARIFTSGIKNTNINNKNLPLLPISCKRRTQRANEGINIANWYSIASAYNTIEIGDMFVKVANKSSSSVGNVSILETV